MILSTSHNFIFIHIPKTAGSAMTVALERFGLPRGRSTWRSLMRRLPVVEAPERAYLRNHDPARAIAAKLGRAVFDRFHSFAVVRNPFDHAVSHYENMKTFRIARVAEKVARMSFEEYLHYRMKPPFWNDTFFARHPNQAWFVTDAEGRIMVNRILYLETLDGDFARLVTDLGLDGVQLQHLNASRLRPKDRAVTDYYDATTTEMVRRFYAEDFRLFGYGPDPAERMPVRRIEGRGERRGQGA